MAATPASESKGGCGFEARRRPAAITTIPPRRASSMREGGWLDSGDLAYVADGELYITGRAKDVIIKGGRNLYPHEMEDIAGRVAGVRTGCVVAFGVPDAAQRNREDHRDGRGAQHGRVRRASRLKSLAR